MHKRKITFSGQLSALAIGGVLAGASLTILIGEQSFTPKHLTASDAKEMYQELKKYTGAPEIIPPLSIQNDPVINAYASNNEIIVTTGMLNFCRTKDELAAVIGHEMGHILMAHTIVDRALIDSRVQESNADKFGVYLMLRVGYNICDAKRLWIDIREKEGDSTMTSSHPDYSFREWSLTFPECK